MDRWTDGPMSVGAFHLVKISGISGSAVNGTCFVGSSYWKILGKSSKSKKVGPFSRLERFERISCSIYTFLVLYISSNCYQLRSHLGVPSGNGLAALPGFTIKWNNFLPIGKSPFFPTEI